MGKVFFSLLLSKQKSDNQGIIFRSCQIVSPSNFKKQFFCLPDTHQTRDQMRCSRRIPMYNYGLQGPYYGRQNPITTLLIIIQFHSFEKVHISVVGCCCGGGWFSFLITGLDDTITYIRE